jgi:hypothetical protein
MTTHTKLQKAKQDYKATKEDVKWYQQAVRSLMYIMLRTRPDIIYTVLVVSRFAANLDQLYKAAVTRILQYLQRTANYVLMFKGTLSDLAGYTDAN